MMDYAERNGLDSIITWVLNGRAIKINDPDRLVSLLPLFFGQTKYRSFRRQLNMWHFERILEGPHAGGFMHPYFVRDQVELSGCMSRQVYIKPKRRQGKQADGKPRKASNSTTGNSSSIASARKLPASSALTAMDPEKASSLLNPSSRRKAASANLPSQPNVEGMPFHSPKLKRSQNDIFTSPNTLTDDIKQDLYSIFTPPSRNNSQSNWTVSNSNNGFMQHVPQHVHYRNFQEQSAHAMIRKNTELDPAMLAPTPIYQSPADVSMPQNRHLVNQVDGFSNGMTSTSNMWTTGLSPSLPLMPPSNGPPPPPPSAAELFAWSLMENDMDGLVDGPSSFAEREFFDIEQQQHSDSNNSDSNNSDSNNSNIDRSHLDRNTRVDPSSTSTIRHITIGDSYRLL